MKRPPSKAGVVATGDSVGSTPTGDAVTLTKSQLRNRQKLRGTVRRRAELCKKLAKPGENGGGLCDECGNEHPFEKLEIDHINGRVWQPRELSPSMRVARYWREFLGGIALRALCRSCNARDGGHRRWKR